MYCNISDKAYSNVYGYLMPCEDANKVRYQFYNRETKEYELITQDGREAYQFARTNQAKNECSITACVHNGDPDEKWVMNIPMTREKSDKWNIPYAVINQ